MADNPKEYKYKLEADDFVKLFLASDDEFQKLQQQLFNNIKNGIDRKNGYTRLMDVEIEGNIIINDVSVLNCSPLICDEAKFKSFTIRRSKLMYGNGHVGIYLQFNDCEIENLCCYVNSAIGDIYFTDCNIGFIEISSSTIDFCFIRRSEAKSIKINSNSKTNDFNIYESITGNFVIKDSSAGNFDFDKSSIKDFELINSRGKDITFDSGGTGNIKIQKSILESISLDSCSTGDLELDNSIIQKFTSNLLYCNFTLSNSTISYFETDNCYIPEFRIEQLCKIDAYIIGGQINYLNFYDATITKDSLFSFSKTRLYFLQMEEFSMLGSLYYKSIIKAEKEFDWLNIEEFIKFLEIESNLKPKIIGQIFSQHLSNSERYKGKCDKLKKKVEQACIRISHSSLGKTEFIDFPFPQYRFEYNNSRIFESTFIGNTIPLENVQIINIKNGEIEEHFQMASLCNQLKKVFEAQGDIYNATQFQAKWAEEQREYLCLKRKEESKKTHSLWSKAKILFNPTSNDIYTLWLNRISNLHGESWTQTLGVFFGLIIPIIYLILLSFIGRISLSAEFDCNLFWKYFEFLNPAHGMKFIDEENEIKGGAILVDFIGRIVVSYAIYQFISAFRKHTKKQ